MVVYLAAVVAVIGVLIYLLGPADNAHVVEVGRIMFWVGLLVFLLRFTAAALNF